MHDSKEQSIEPALCRPPGQSGRDNVGASPRDQTGLNLLQSTSLRAWHHWGVLVWCFEVPFAGAAVTW